MKTASTHTRHKDILIDKMNKAPHKTHRKLYTVSLLTHAETHVIHEFKKLSDAVACADGYYDHFTYNECVEVFIVIRESDRRESLMFLDVHGEFLWAKKY